MNVVFHKVDALPADPDPSAFYYVLNGSRVNSYLTDTNGVPKEILNEDFIRAIIAEASDPTKYSEFTYTDDNLTLIDTWEDATKSTKIFIKTFGYTGDNLTTILLSDVISGIDVLSTFGYTGDNLTSINKVIN